MPNIIVPIFSSKNKILRQLLKASTGQVNWREADKIIDAEQGELKKEMEMVKAILLISGS